MTSRTSRWRGVSVTSAMGEDLRAGRPGAAVQVFGTYRRHLDKARTPVPGTPVRCWALTSNRRSGQPRTADRTPVPATTRRPPPDRLVTPPEENRLHGHHRCPPPPAHHHPARPSRPRPSPAAG